MYGSRRSEYYLSRNDPPPPRRPTTRNDPPPPSPGNEDLLWQSAMRFDTVAVYLEYERQYPNGKYVVMARDRVAALRLGPDPVPDPPGRTIRPGQVFRDCAACPEMMVIPAGNVHDGVAGVGRGPR